MADASIKLYYFDAKGIAEMSRLLMAAAGKEFEDIRVSREDWPNMKESMPGGQLPVLEVNGKKYGQAVAMVSYLAKELGFYGESNLDGLVIGGVLGLLQDMIQNSRKIFFETDETKKAEEEKTFTEEVCRKCFGIFENMLKESGTGYFVGKKLSLADIVVYEVYTGYMSKFLCSLDKFELLNGLMEKVGQQDKIKAYMASRAVTPF